MEKLTLNQYFEAFRVKIALKIVLSGIICILINNIFHLHLAYFSLLFVFLILSLFHGQVLSAGIRAFIVSLISGALTLIISYLFLDSKLAYVALTSIWIFFVIALNFKYFLSLLVGGVASTMAMYTSIYDSLAQAANTFDSYMIQLLLAIIVAWIVDSLIWPNRSRGVFQLTLKTVYKDLSELFGGYLSENAAEKKNRRSLSISLITFSNLVNYVNRMQQEEKDKDFPIDMYMKIITFSRGIYIKIEVLEDLLLKDHMFLKNDKVEKNLSRIMTLISESFSVMSSVIGTDSPSEIKDKELKDQVESIHQIYREMHEVKDLDDEYYEDLHAFGAMLPVIDDITDKILRISEAINVFHNNQYSVMMAERLTHTKQVENKRKSSFLYIDQDGFRAGVKTVVIFLILMFGEVVIGLPGGGQVVFFAILFGVIPNLGQAFMKSRYGIIGVVLGITFCFISIMVISISPHFLIVISLYSLATFIAAYIASSSKDIAVSGLQAGLLFPFGLLLTTGPNLDISDAFTRFLALFSAVFIGLIVQHLLWPTNPYSLLKEKISKSIRISGEIISDLITLKTENEEKAQKLILPLAAVLPTSTQLLHDAEYVIRSNELHAEEIIHIIESIEFMYADLETLNRTIIQFKDKSSMEDFITNLDSRYRQITELFEDVSGQFNSKHNFCDQINDLKTDIEEHVHEYRKEGSWRNFDPKDVENQVLVHTSMLSLLDSLYKISSEIDKINQNKILVQGALNPREA